MVRCGGEKRISNYGSGSQTFSNGDSLAKSRFSQGSKCQILTCALCEIATANNFLCRDR